MDLRTFADWTLKPRLLSVPGVAKCSSFGGEVRQLQIQVQPDRLLAYDLALSDVLNAARVSTAVLGAGFIETRNQRITIQTEGQALTPEVLARWSWPTRTASASGSRTWPVSSKAPNRSMGLRRNGPAGRIDDMSSQYGANTMEVTLALEAALAELKPVFAKEGITVYRGCTGRPPSSRPRSAT